MIDVSNPSHNITVWRIAYANWTLVIEMTFSPPHSIYSINMSIGAREDGSMEWRGSHTITGLKDVFNDGAFGESIAKEVQAKVGNDMINGHNPIHRQWMEEAVNKYLMAFDKSLMRN